MEGPVPGPFPAGNTVCKEETLGMPDVPPGMDPEEYMTYEMAADGIISTEELMAATHSYGADRGKLRNLEFEADTPYQARLIVQEATGHNFGVSEAGRLGFTFSSYSQNEIEYVKEALTARGKRFIS